MNSERILFVQPPTSLEDVYGGLAAVGAVSPPLSLLHLAAVVREHGFEPIILDCPACEVDYRGAVERVRAVGPKYVGITAMTPHILQANRLAEAIKAEMPEVTVLLGGAHVSAVPEETMRRFPSIDIAAIGEADYSLPELLLALRDGKPASTVRGLMVRDGAELRYTGDRQERVAMDRLPLPAWDILDGFPQGYRVPLFAAHRRPATPIITSRGCPGKCIFCYSGFHATIATYSAEYVFEMLRHLKERYGIREFQIYDDNFTMYRKNLSRLLRLMIERRLDMTWSCNARVDMVTEQMLAQMAQAGCWQISFGIETGNEAIRAALKKEVTNDQIARAVGWTRRAGIRTVGYFMVGHFGETPQTIDETVRFATGLGLDDFRMSFFTPLPGTPSYALATRYGQFDDDWGKMTLFSPVFIPSGMTRDELISAQKRALRRFFFRPRAVWSYLKMVHHPRTVLQGAWAFGRYVFGGRGN